MLLGFGCAVHAAGHRFVREAGFPHWTIAVLWRGTARFALAGGVAEAGALDTILIRPRTPYAVAMPRGGEESWVILTPPPMWESLLDWPEAVTGLAVVPGGEVHAAAARSAFREAVTWWESVPRREDGLALNALERSLMLLALDRPGRASDNLHPAVRATLDLLAPGPAEALDVPAIARRVGCSPSHLAHRFRAEMGMPLRAWLEDRRIARARHLLLHTGWPVKRIAATCGFADGEHLARRFRARVGRSPGAWRRRPTA